MKSPWNIAVDFHVDMSFSAHDIAGMLKKYEVDHHTGMDTETIAGSIYAYTSGYPFLVSKLCKLLDEVVVREDQFSTAADAWTTNGVSEAVRILLSEENTLFESMVNKLRTYQELYEIIYAILFHGKTISFNPLDSVIEIAVMFGFIKNVDGTVVIANRIIV